MAYREPVCLGATKRFTPDGGALLKDGAAWNLAGATVTIRFRPPDGLDADVVSFSATVTDAAAGEVEYTNAADLFDAVGVWSVSFKVVQGAVEEYTPPYTFLVARCP